MASWLDACAQLADEALAAERVVRAFARAHAIDATIPAMPLTTLATVLGRRRARTTAATPAPVTG